MRGVMQLFWIRCVFLCLGLGLGEAAKAKFYCRYTSSSDKKIIFSLDKESDTISLVYTQGSVATRCGSSVSHYFTGKGTQASPYKFTFDLTDIIQNNECNVKKDKNIYRVTIITQESAKVLRITDKQYVLQCDMSKLIKASSAAAQAVSVDAKSSPLTDGISTKVTGATKIELLDHSKSSKAVSGAKLGTNVSLRLTLTETAAGSPTGIWVSNCLAGSDDKFSKQITFLDDKGCGLPNASIIDSNTGFNGSSEGRVAESPIFSLFQFPGVSTLAFRCQVNYCFKKKEPRCLRDNQCVNTRKKRQAAPLVRAKRAADQSSATVTKLFLLRDDDTETCERVTGNTGMVPSKQCFSSTAFVTSTVLLSLLVVISVALALVFYLRLVHIYKKQ